MSTAHPQGSIASCDGIGGVGAAAQLELFLAVANDGGNTFVVTTSGWGHVRDGNEAQRHDDPRARRHGTTRLIACSVVPGP